MPQRRDRDEGPSDADTERFGGETRPCPKCGAAIFDDSEWCHKCGSVLTAADEHKPKPWILITVAVLVGLMLVGLFRWI